MALDRKNVMHRIANLVSLITVFILAASSLAEPPALEFKIIMSKEGRFRVDMPGTPKVTVQKTSIDNFYTFEVALPEPSTVRFAVSYIDLRDADVQGADPQKILQIWRDGARKGATFEDDKEISLGKAKIPGRDYRVQVKSAKGQVGREEMFLAGKRLYVLAVGGQVPKDYLNSKEANQFFDSFTITSVAAVAAGNTELQKFTSKELGFSIEMPGKPMVSSRDLGMGMMEYDFEVRNGLKIFRVIVTDVGNVMPKNKDPQLILKAFRDGFRKDTLFEDDKEIVSVAKNAYPGREYQVDMGNGIRVREEMFVVGTRFYTLHIVSDNKEYLASNDANRFFDSWQIATTGTDPKK